MITIISPLFLKKKAIVSLNTLILIIILLLFLFASSYYFYYDSKSGAEIRLAKQENLNALISFRAALVTAVANNQSNLTYQSNFDKDEIEIRVYNTSYLAASQDLDAGETFSNVSTFGIEFCSNYTFYPVEENTFNFNGTCVEKLN